MGDYLSYLPYISIAAIVLGLAGLALSYRKRGRQEKTKSESYEVVADWRPTGKIDFSQIGSDDAPRFALQTEDYRVLQSLSGTKHVEVRWRPATLDEAKRIARWNNARETILGLRLPDSASTPSLVPNLTLHEPLTDDDHVGRPERPH